MDYTLDKAKFIEQLLPVKLRTDIRKDWLGAILDPEESLHADFITKVAEIRLELSRNGQKISMEAYLNDLFDNTDRRIYIDDPTSVFVNVFLYLIAEGQINPTLYYISEFGTSPDDELFLYQISEYEATEEDFVVYYPDTITPDLDAMNRAIKKVKKAAKRYTIDTFTP